MLRDPQVVHNALNVPGAAPQLGEIFHASGYAPRVLRYEVYNAKGRLLFTSGQANLRLDGPPLNVTNNATQQASVVSLQSGAGKNDSSNFAVLRVPINFAANERGTLIVYLDQSDQASVLSSYFSVIALVTLTLLGVGVTMPAAFAWMRSRERRQAEEQVHYLQNHDALTGLANRRAFAERLGDATARMKQDDTHIAVICLDIDKFKEINDSTEHGGGDQVRREIGMRINETLRDRDIIARLGADEFAIALVDVSNLGDVMAFMNRLVAALQLPFRIADKEILITTSVGIALAPA
ncbi:MAG: diguanylate cyclase domain-containing protein, partial [Alphaproteobacteria bacterium]